MNKGQILSQLLDMRKAYRDLLKVVEDPYDRKREKALCYAISAVAHHTIEELEEMLPVEDL